MSKVICDICGTSYPETAPKCPICGYAKTATESTAAGADRNSSEGGYASAKGGHFSKKNVRKRTGSTASEKSRRSQSDDSSNTGLILVVIFLLVAIVAVVIYIGLRVFKAPDTEAPQPIGTTQATLPTQTTPTDATDPEDPTVEPTDPADPTVDPTASADPTGATEDNSVPCESMQLSNQTIEFVKAGDTWTIQVRPTPANTTQSVVFTSSDLNVVTVDETGLLTAVGGGEATITVTCGTVTETCQIKCSFETPTVPPTEPSTEDPTGATTDAPTTDATTDPTAPTGTTTTEPTTATTVAPTGPVDPNFTFAFNTKFQDATSGKWDTTLDELGETWRAYKTDLSVDPSAITWTTDDPTVCTVENGVVTGIGPGKTEVHAQYGGKTFTCIIRCTFEAGEIAPTVAPTEPATQATTVNPTGPTTEVPTTAATVKPTVPTTAAPTEPVDPNFTFAFNTIFKDETSGKWDTTLDEEGETWRAYEKDMPVDVGAITWTSDDPGVCTIKDGVVTAVADGKTEIHAQYGGQTYTCIIRVKFAQ